MKHPIRAILAPVSALCLMLATPALAQTSQQNKVMPMMGAQQGMTPMMGGGMMGPMMGGGMMGPMMGGGMMGMMHYHPDGSLAFLKAELAITAAQETVWKAYTDQLRENIKQHRPGMQMMYDPAAAKPAGWIERMSAGEARISAHLETIKKIRPAAEALYAALSPEQKQKADALMPGGMGMMGGMGGMGMMGGTGGMGGMPMGGMHGGQ